MKNTLLPVLLASLALSFPAHAQQAPGTGLNYETRLSTIEDTMRSLNGKVEQLDFTLRRLEQTLQRMQADVDGRLSRLESAQAALQQAQAAAPAQSTPTPNNIASSTSVTEANGTLGAIRMQDGRVTGGVNNPKAPPLPDTPADYGLTPEEQYQRAFELLRKVDYIEAEKAFKAFIEKNPKDKQIDSAKYWYGETLYVQDRYDEAAVAFAEAFQQNPQGNKAPDSLLKLAMTLAALEKTQDACTALVELKAKYPKAPPNVRTLADQQRTKLKCGKG